MDQHIAAIHKRISMMNQAAEKYESQRSLMGEAAYYKLKEFSTNFEKDALAIVESNRKLKIGVVGQIKAGKSSFLNALLFDGKDLLPKAATPMTAALTVIGYAEKPRAEIEFYTNDEWLMIMEKANSYEQLLEQKRQELSQGRSKLTQRFQAAKEKTKARTLSMEELKAIVQAPDDIKTAYELLTMANKSTISVKELLGSIKVIDHVKETSELIGELKQYVGAEGPYTPIVKSTKVYIPNEVLRAIEVVDTPGINDPIISRGQRTREYLGKCDVIFLLSYSGQFMDSVDVELLTQNIPDKGIVNVVLLGSKFDSVLQDIGGRQLSQSIAIASRKLNDQARQAVLPILQQFPDNQVLQSLQKSLPPIFISSMAYNIAHEYPNLSKEQQHILLRLQATFPDDHITPDLLKDLSNMDRIKEVEMQKVLQNKEQILNERFHNLLDAQSQAFIKELSKVKEELERDLHRLAHSSSEDLEKHFQMINRGMNQARKKVDLVFSRNMLEMEKGFRQMKIDFKESALRYRKFNETSETKREVVGTERYGFLWLKKRNVYESRTYSYANVHQVIDNIENLVLDLDKRIKTDFENIIQMHKLTLELKNAVKGIFDLADENFDFEDVLIPVEKTVNKISIPKFEVSSNKHRDVIIHKFGMGKVEGSDVSKLREMQYYQIDDVLREVEENIDQTITNVQAVFAAVSVGFINDVLKESEQKQKKLQEELKNLQETKVQYGRLLEELTHDIHELKNHGNQAFRAVQEWEKESQAYSQAKQEMGTASQEAAATVEKQGTHVVLLVQGQRVQLPQAEKYEANISHDTGSIKVDLSAFMLQKNGKVSGEQDFIFYNQPTHISQSVAYIEQEAQQIEVIIANIPDVIEKIVFTSTICPHQIQHVNFSMVKDLHFSLYKNGTETISFPIKVPFYKETGIVLAEMYRYKSSWRIGAVARGFDNGLKGLCALFGVEAE